MRQIKDTIYVIMAFRYGEECNGYYLGWEEDLEKAKALADKEWNHRGQLKYSGVVYKSCKGDKGIEVYRKGI